MARKILTIKDRDAIEVAIAILDSFDERTLTKKLASFVVARDLPDDELREYQAGRNFIRLDDTVKVKPSRPGKRDGFMGSVYKIKSAGDGGPKEVTVVDQVSHSYYTVKPERIVRIAQSRVVKRDRP